MVAAAHQARPTAGGANLADLVRHAAETAPSRTALVAGERRVDWAELDRAVDAAAAGLAGAGLVAGYRVGLALANSVEFVAAYFGALRAGFVVVPLNPQAPARELVRALEHTRARVLLADQVSLPAARTAGAPLIVAVDAPAEPGERSYEELLAKAPAVPPVPPMDDETLAVLLFTSGTSAAPRAAMLTHRALLASLDQLAAIEPPPIGPDDIVLGLVPFFHVYGLNGVLGPVVRAAATLVLTEGAYDPDRVLDLIAAEKVTTVPAAPPVFVSWSGRSDLTEQLSGVRLLLSGAAPLPIQVAEEIQTATGLTVHEGYGLTEACPAVASTLCSQVRKPGSVGEALPGVEVRLAGGAGEEPGEDPGEVLVRGPNLFSGYWPDGADGPDAEGWFATGDLGYLDADGDLFLVDRSKELIVVSGFNVYPREVEEIVAELSEVTDVAVVGGPDPRTGETVIAYVVPAIDPPPDDLAERIREHCQRSLARFKCPSRIEVVDALPKSAAGKIAKARLRTEEWTGQ